MFSQLSIAVHPHPGIPFRFFAGLVQHLHHRLIRVDDAGFQKLCLHLLPNRLPEGAGRVNHPIGYGGPGQIYPFGGKICLSIGKLIKSNPVKGHGVAVFLIHDMCQQFRRAEAVGEHRLRDSRFPG